MNWQPQLKYVYHGNMMTQVTIDQILFDIMKKTGKKRNIYTWIQLQDAFRAIFTERFAIVKVYLFYLNATSDQLTQNLPHLSKIHLGEFPFIHLYICSPVMGLEAAERVSDSLASAH